MWRDYEQFIAELTARFPHEAAGIRKFYDECWKVCMHPACQASTLRIMWLKSCGMIVLRWRGCAVKSVKAHVGKLWPTHGGTDRVVRMHVKLLRWCQRHHAVMTEIQGFQEALNLT